MTIPPTLGPMPADRLVTTVDEHLVRAPIRVVFEVAADVERWPRYLAHYRFVRVIERAPNGDALVEMSANRPFGGVGWPTWWTSWMTVSRPDGERRPSIRFRHIRGVTSGMDVEGTFEERAGGTLARIVHVWNGPPVPVIGALAARLVIGPVFVHGIASRTLAGLAKVAERGTDASGIEVGRG